MMACECCIEVYTFQVMEAVIERNAVKISDGCER